MLKAQLDTRKKNAVWLWTNTQQATMSGVLLFPKPN